MRERIEEIIRIFKLSSSQFAESIGIQRSALSHILNGRNNPSLDVVMKIYQSFPNISLEWLLTGKGFPPLPSSAGLSSAYDDDNKMQTTIIGQQQLSPSLAANANNMPDLFDENSKNPAASSRNREFSRENEATPPVSPYKHTDIETVKLIEKAPPKITEIRIFFENGTFQTFFPEKEKI